MSTEYLKQAAILGAFVEVRATDTPAVRRFCRKRRSS